MSARPYARSHRPGCNVFLTNADIKFNKIIANYRICDDILKTEASIQALTIVTDSSSKRINQCAAVNHTLIYQLDKTYSINTIKIS